MYFYQRIRDTREDNDYTQKDIATLLDLHLTQYRRYETGETEIPVHILIKLSKLYKKSMEYLTEIQIKM
ncbi:MAG: helix-turn-helix transcriptional regulator [Oscillospiraceae bacterium]|nr:helix-turn-helix transcriptional regulator [Oscillospiraceae bacterium]